MRSVFLAVSLVCAPLFAAHAAEAVDEGRPIVIGKSYALQSKILGDARRLNVYLPPDYKDASRRFPVLVLLDGGEAEDFHHITGLAQVTAFNGAVEELIVVGIEGVDRKHDLTSPSADPEDVKLDPTSGGAAAYRKFLVEEVKPWIAAHYRVSGRYGLIGESLAGLFAVEACLLAPQSFDDYIAASPSLWWDKESLSREAAADFAKGDFKGRQLWLSVGDEGTTMQEAIDRVVAASNAVHPVGFALHYDPRPAERHDTIYEPTAIAALRTLYAVKKP
jgi:predicted alpha/beta superfamily hydrolase